MPAPKKGPRLTGSPQHQKLMMANMADGGKTLWECMQDADRVQNRVADLLHEVSLYCGHRTLTAEAAKTAKQILLCGLGGHCVMN